MMADARRMGRLAPAILVALLASACDVLVGISNVTFADASSDASVEDTFVMDSGVMDVEDAKETGALPCDASADGMSDSPSCDAKTDEGSADAKPLDEGSADAKPSDEGSADAKPSDD